MGPVLDRRARNRREGLLHGCVVVVGLCGGGCKTPKWLSAESGSGKGEDESANGCYESPLQYRKYDLQGRQMRVT